MKKVMNTILGIETSQDACSVAILAGNDITVSHEIAPRQQAKLLLGMIDKTLKQAHVSLGDLDAIAFGCGPGSFTGLRIAAGVAQGLAYAISKPLIPVSCLQIIAQEIFNATHISQVIVAIDARLREVYWGAYTRDESSEMMIGQDFVGAPETVTLPISGDFAIIGNGWSVYESLMPSVKCKYKKETIEPSAKTLVEIASKKEGGLSPSLGVPHYIRDKVAIDSTV